jgi:hypothetical protein
MSLSGNLKTMDLPELLQWVAMGRKTGTLSFIRNKVKNYIYLKDGLIISSRSNEPTKQLGHYLLFQGKLTEAQLKRGLDIHMATRVVLGRVLVGEGFITEEEVARALGNRTEEVVYDLFLWEDGYFQFTPDSYKLEDLFVIRLEINSVLFEGVRRKDEWVRIRSVFPGNEVVLAMRQHADLRGVTLSPVQKKLLFLVTLGKTISQMILELHGSDFSTNFELFQLYELGLVEVKEVREIPVPEQDLKGLVNKGLDLMARSKHSEALAVFQEVLKQDPQNVVADEQTEIAERAICEGYYRGSIPASRIPYLLVPESALTRASLTHQEGFVASRINGAWDVKSIVMLSPLREIEILQTIDKLIQMKLAALR